MTTKLFIFISCYVTSTVYSDMQFINKMFTDMVNEHKSPNENTKNETDLLRGIHSITYGCWCFFDVMPIMDGQKKPFTPKGTPVDELDRSCKMLNDGYECILDDYKYDKAGNICEPRHVDSNIPTDWVPLSKKTDGEILADCIQLNDGHATCEAFVCLIEVAFLRSFWNKLTQPDHDWDGFGHAWDTYGVNVDINGDYYDYSTNLFDPETECISGRGTGILDPIDANSKNEPALKSCCGSYPYRSTYRPNDNTIGCCGDKTYSTSLQECCPGDVISIGGC